jgi:hypothetical protein
MIEHFDYLVNATQEELATLIANLDSTREEDAASEAHHEDADTIEMSAPEPGSIIKGYLEMQAREVKKDISGWYRRNKSCWLRPRDPFLLPLSRRRTFTSQIFSYGFLEVLEWISAAQIAMLSMEMEILR